MCNNNGTADIDILKKWTYLLYRSEHCTSLFILLCERCNKQSKSMIGMIGVPWHPYKQKNQLIFLQIPMDKVPVKQLDVLVHCIYSNSVDFYFIFIFFFCSPFSVSTFIFSLFIEYRLQMVLDTLSVTYKTYRS